MTMLFNIEQIINSIDFSSNNHTLLEAVINLALVDIRKNPQEIEQQKKKIRLELEKAIALNTDCSTLLKFIAKKRLEKAKEIMCKEKSPKVAALSAGFNDLSNFSKQFKGHYHLTPRQFLKQQNNS